MLSSGLIVVVLAYGGAVVFMGLMTMVKLRSSRLLNQAVLSMADQAWLSALNLALGLLLIRMVSKESYGVYTQLFAAGLFATSILEALVSNPLINVVFGKSGHDRSVIIQTVNRYQAHLSTLVAVLMGLGCAGVAVSTGQHMALMLGAVFGLFVKFNALREYARSLAFLNGKPGSVLYLDLWYGASILFGISMLLCFSSMHLIGVFAVFALANLGAWLLTGRQGSKSKQRVGHYPDIVRQMWHRGRLGLPGACLAWGVSYGYLYLVAAWLGAAAAAELTASRLLLMPVVLWLVAWSRVVRPRIGILLVQNFQQELNRLLIRSMTVLLVMAGLYIATLWLGLPWLMEHVLAGKYDVVESLLPWWGIYFIIYTVRWVGTVALLGRDFYGFMLVVSLLSFSVVCTVLMITIPHFGLYGAIIALIAVELLSLSMVWGKYMCSK